MNPGLMQKLLVRATDPSSTDGEREMAKRLFWREVEKAGKGNVIVATGKVPGSGLEALAMLYDLQAENLKLKLEVLDLKDKLRSVDDWRSELYFRILSKHRKSALWQAVYDFIYPDKG